MLKMLGGVVIALGLALAVQWDNARTLASENAKHEKLITALTHTNESQAQAIIEHEARALEIESALTSRNTELRELAQRYASQRNYLTELTRSNQDAKAFIDSDLPNSIACLFLVNPEAGAGLPTANCAP